MLRKVASKVAWVGRTASMVFGLALVLALMFGVASMALANNGDPWLLGRSNVATAITSLGGKLGVNGPMLQLINNNAGANDTALALNVQAGEPPMRVNSTTKVPGLNADRLDGRDSAGFLSSKIYIVSKVIDAPANSSSSEGLSCDAEDRAISGGFLGVDSPSYVRDSYHDRALKNIWNVTVVTGSTADRYEVQAECSDFPPLRP